MIIFGKCDANEPKYMDGKRNKNLPKIVYYLKPPFPFLIN